MQVLNFSPLDVHYHHRSSTLLYAAICDLLYCIFVFTSTSEFLMEQVQILKVKDFLCFIVLEAIFKMW